VDVFQTVRGSGMGAFSIFYSSKPVDLDLKSTRDLVRMRGRGGGEPKLGGALFSLNTARRQNPSTEWKWKQVEALGPWINLI
jgi:hypothetical protein